MAYKNGYCTHDAKIGTCSLCELAEAKEEIEQLRAELETQRSRGDYWSLRWEKEHQDKTGIMLQLTAANECARINAESSHHWHGEAVSLQTELTAAREQIGRASMEADIADDDYVKATRAAARLARTLKDLYNNCGEIEEVSAAFKAVEKDIDDYFYLERFDAKDAIESAGGGV